MFRFGVTTDTLDSYGKITEKGRSVNSREIEEALGKFQGKIVQVPPKYSACSINGVKAYKLARNEVEFEIKPKEVEIYLFRLIEERGEDYRVFGRHLYKESGERSVSRDGERRIYERVDKAGSRSVYDRGSKDFNGYTQ